MDKLKIKSLENIAEVAQAFLKKIKSKKVISFKGEMGVGKTTFIKSLCKELEVLETVNSPTFSIVNEYHSVKGEVIYHFDCYRIESIDEAMEIGVEEYIYSGNYCFIEWAENIASLLPDDLVTIEITEMENGERELIFD